MLSDKVYKVQARWDEDGQVWWAESDVIPGLVAEADTFEELVGVVHGLAPDLLELNGSKPKKGVELPIQVFAERMTRVRIASYPICG